MPAAVARTRSAAAGLRRWSLLGGVGAVILVALTAALYMFIRDGAMAGDRSEEKATHTITGTVQTALGSESFHCGGTIGPEQALDMLASRETAPCPDGAGGVYGDIADGTQVTVKDAKGVVLAVGSLSGGTYDGDKFAVVFDLSVENVPEEDLYQVEVAHRGALSFSLQDMDVNGWAVWFSLGV